MNLWVLKVVEKINRIWTIVFQIMYASRSFFVQPRHMIMSVYSNRINNYITDDTEKNFFVKF